MRKTKQQIINELLDRVDDLEDDLRRVSSVTRGNQAAEFRPVPRVTLMAGTWIIYTLDDYPLQINAKWVGRETIDPLWDPDENDPPVFQDGDFMIVVIGPGETVKIPMARVTYVDERIWEREPEPPAPLPPDREVSAEHGPV
jgi:hypothetical protein